jgi:hypothetical protein
MISILYLFNNFMQDLDEIISCVYFLQNRVYFNILVTNMYIVIKNPCNNLYYDIIKLFLY